MSVTFGNANIGDIYYGATKITDAYLGSTHVYQSLKPITLTLCASNGGTLTADTITGFPGDTIELAPTYDTYWRLSGYEVYGDGSVSDNTYTFGNDDEQIVSACFKPNAFTATGNFNFSTHTAQGNFSNTYSGYLRAKTGDIPATWGNVNSVFNPSNASSYLMTISAQPTLWTTSFKADFEGRARCKTTNIKTVKQTVPTSQTAKMNLNCTTTLQGDINIYLYCSAGTTAFRKGWTALSPNAWTATGYAP